MYRKCSFIHSFDIQASGELFVLFLLCSASILLPLWSSITKRNWIAVLRHHCCSTTPSSLFLQSIGSIPVVYWLAPGFSEPAYGQLQADCTVSWGSGSGKGRRKPLPESKQPSNTTIALDSTVNSVNS